MKKLLYILLFTPLALFGQNNNVLINKSDKPVLISDSLKLYYENLEKNIYTKSISDSRNKITQLSTLNKSSVLPKDLPYPILFVHGLTGSSQTWLEFTDFLEPALGETIKLDFCLNADENLNYSNMINDVVSFIPENLASSNLYKVTFNCNASGDCYSGGSTNNNGLFYSNQAAITKQGKAIGIAVNSILEATGKSKVVLIGHSMGGLAIREYLQNSIHWLTTVPSSLITGFYSYNPCVAKLITVGTPHCGSDIEYAGLDWLGDDGVVTEVRATSEAVRDLRSRYDFFGFASTPGAFIWGGIESQNYMDDNLCSSWDNVDVTCNGITGESVTGINYKLIDSSIEYSSIRDINDDVVSPGTADYNWEDESTGGEDFCSVLSHFEGDFYCENWNIDAQGFMGGHGAMPSQISNLWAIDEPDGLDLSNPTIRSKAYEINFDKSYAGFFTPQGHSLNSTVENSDNDYDNYRIYIPSDGVLEINAIFGSSVDSSMCSFEGFNLWNPETESYINGILCESPNVYVSSYNLVSQGNYFVQFFGNASEEDRFRQYFYNLNFTPSVPSEQIIQLPEGWSMLSTFMSAEAIDITSLIAPIVDDVIIVKDNNGAAYLTEFNFNGIGDIEIGQGYQIKTSAEVSLVVSGDYINPEDHSIVLSAGWNMIGYLRLESADAAAVLADINASANLTIAKDYSGNTYLPEWNFNGMGDLHPGQGYQLKTIDADVLTMLSNDEQYRTSSLEFTKDTVSHFATIAVTDNNMTVVIEDAAWDVLPREGAEIAAFDKLGTLIGSASYTSPTTVLTVWGDDILTTTKEGLSSEEELTFKLWNTNLTQSFRIDNWRMGSSTYHANAINIASSIVTNNAIHNSSSRTLVRIVNLLGQEVNIDDNQFGGGVLFEIYDDGSVEKLIR